MVKKNRDPKPARKQEGPGRLESVVLSLAKEAREMDAAMERVEAESVELEGQLDLLTQELSKAERRLEEVAHLRRLLPDGVTRLRDGSYETDEKIRLLASVIRSRTLPELEAMFAK